MSLHLSGSLEWRFRMTDEKLAVIEAAKAWREALRALTQSVTTQASDPEFIKLSDAADDALCVLAMTVDAMEAKKR